MEFFEQAKNDASRPWFGLYGVWVGERARIYHESD
jgi:hypothetical protein